MQIAYVDDSGDRGAGGSRTYTLGCVLVRSGQWKEALDGIVGFRRFLKATFGVPMRAEIKANYLLRNGGDLASIPLSEHSRRFIYTGHLRLQRRLNLSAFAIVINKARLNANVDPFLPAWTYLIQRLERLSANNGEEVLIIHDEGEPLLVRTLARKARRAGTAGSLFGGYLNVPFTGLLDDPVSRVSKTSYFLQLADLTAYAAFRRVYAPPARKVKIVPQLMWEELDTARYAPANRRAGGPSQGIVLWPRPA
jgi:hypothetical protein